MSERKEYDLTLAAAAEETSQLPTLDNPQSYFDAPFRYQNDTHENAILNSGNLQYTTTDLVYPGKNGLDLVIARRYDMQEAGKEKAVIAYLENESAYNGLLRIEERYRYPDGSSETVINYEDFYGFGSEHRLETFIKRSVGFDEFDEWIEYADGTNYTMHIKYTLSKNRTRGAYRTEGAVNDYVLNRYGLGYGWSFAFPSIEKVRYSQNNERTIYRDYLHLEDGRSLLIATSMRAGKSNFEKSPLLDVRIQRDDGVYVVYYKDGREAHFNGEKELSYLCDKFGNRITFEHTSGKLSKITDTFGRVFLLTTVNDRLCWVRQDTNEVEYRYSVVNNMLASSSDKLGRSTGYTYDDTVSCTQTLSPYYMGDSDVELYYCLLTEITHPTGARTKYEYRPLTLEPQDEVYQSMPFLTTRRDIINGIPHHEVTYQYGGENQKRISNATVLSHQNAQGQYETKTIHTFGPAHLREKEECRHYIDGDYKLMLERIFVNGTNEELDYQLPIRETETRYGTEAGTSITKIQTWDYQDDKKGNVIKHTESYPEESGHNQEAYYSYDPLNSIVTYKAYRKDSSTWIVEKYTLHEGKLYQSKRIYETANRENPPDSDLREKTLYAYDSAYRLTGEQRYSQQEGQTGTLESSNRYVTTAYRYNAGYFTPEPAEIELIGVQDADGGNAASPYGSGIIRQSFVYDWHGRTTRKTDSKNNATDYSYDALGRMRQETYPAINGTRHSKTIQYDDTFNRITETDENGISRRQEFTPLGKIAKVSITTGGPETLLASYEYDALERLSAEKSYYENGSVKATTSYLYDTFDRVLKKTLPNSMLIGTTYYETHSYTDLQDGRYFRDHTTVSSISLRDILAGLTEPKIIRTTDTDTDRFGNLCREKVGGSETTHTYGKLNEKISTTDAKKNRNSRSVTTYWTYDYAGRVLSELNARNQTARTSYDALGNKLETEDFAGRITRFTYDSAGRMIKQDSPLLRRVSGNHEILLRRRWQSNLAEGTFKQARRERALAGKRVSL